MAKYWSLEDAREQRGRIVIVTGANTGLGYETALALAGLGARVILACRSRDKAEAAKQRITSQYPSSEVEVRSSTPVGSNRFATLPNPLIGIMTGWIC